MFHVIQFSALIGILNCSHIMPDSTAVFKWDFSTLLDKELLQALAQMVSSD